MKSPTRTSHLSTRELVLFAMLGTLMYISKVLLEFLPNIHLLGMFTMVFTIVYRRKALIPVYICVLLIGLLNGFAAWWIPHLYLWTVLWGVTMLLPRRMSARTAVPVYMTVCALHGLCYGTLYAPSQALLYGLNFQQTITWIIAGLPWDVVHAAGNLVAGILIVPLVQVLRRLEQAFPK
jgi:energy-coupling factor transport system substrate-specific component